MIAGVIERGRVVMVCAAGDSFQRRKDRMNINQFGEGWIWGAQKRLSIVIRQSDVELRVWGEMTVKECACDFFPVSFLGEEMEVGVGVYGWKW